MALRTDDVDLVRDRDLVERCQAGDRRAFEDLYLRYFDRLRRYCQRRIQDPAEAEDLAQEAFARAWRALPGLRGDKRFYPWLSVIAGNLCTDLLRKRGRVIPVEDCDPGVAPDDHERLDQAVDAEIALRALDRLAPRHRRVLDLREGSGWSYQRIADHEGVRLPAVEALIWRARQSLKREFTALAGPESGLAVLLFGVVRWWKRSSRAATRAASWVRGATPAPGIGWVTGAVAAGSLVTAMSLSGMGAANASHPLGTGPAPSAAASGHGAPPTRSLAAPSAPAPPPVATPGPTPAAGVAAPAVPAAALGGLPGAGSSSSLPLGGTISGVTGVASGALGQVGSAVGGVTSQVGAAVGPLGPAVAPVGSAASGALGAVSGAVGNLGFTANNLGSGLGSLPGTSGGSLPLP
jgi:RNA polymerase sigma-70 factor (ECF subfamily)